MANRQIIEIDVTWSKAGETLSLNALAEWLANCKRPNDSRMEFDRILVREVKKR